MHKSLGNAVAPDEVIKDYGADMLRLWVSSADYTQDMRISKDILKQLSRGLPEDPQHRPLYAGQPQRLQPRHRSGGLHRADSGAGSAGRWRAITS